MGSWCCPSAATTDRNVNGCSVSRANSRSSGTLRLAKGRTAVSSCSGPPSAPNRPSTSAPNACRNGFAPSPHQRAAARNVSSSPRRASAVTAPVQSSLSGSPKRRARSASSGAGAAMLSDVSRRVTMAAWPVCWSLPELGRPSISSRTSTVTPPSSGKRWVTYSWPGPCVRSRPARSSASTSTVSRRRASANASDRARAPCTSRARTQPGEPRRAAVTSAGSPVGPGRFGSAPPASSAATTGAWPRWTAQVRAVNPPSSTRSGRAPAASSARTTSVCPPHAAPHSGESLPALSRSGEAPAARRRRTTPGSSVMAARYRTVWPSSSTDSGLAPAHSCRTTASSSASYTAVNRAAARSCVFILRPSPVRRVRGKAFRHESRDVAHTSHWARYRTPAPCGTGRSGPAPGPVPAPGSADGRSGRGTTRAAGHGCRG